MSKITQALVLVFLICAAMFMFSTAAKYMALQEYEITNRMAIHEATVNNTVNRILPLQPIQSNEIPVFVATATPFPVQ